jgi:hypothetical protein
VDNSRCGRRPVVNASMSGNDATTPVIARSRDSHNRPGRSCSIRARTQKRSGGLAALFPVASGKGVSWWGLALAWAAVATGTAVSLYRQPGLGALDTVWAEDGTIFLNQAVLDGPVMPIATPYAGYYNLGPRVIGGAISFAPAGYAAALLATAAAACTAAAAVLVYVASAAHLRSGLSRFLVAIIAIVVPVAQGEVPNSISNLQWVGLYVLFWVLVWTPRTWIGRAVAVGVVLFVAGSSMIAVALVPLALLRAVRRPTAGSKRRDRYGFLLLTVLACCLALQFLGLFSSASSRHLALHPMQGVPVYAWGVVPGAIFGRRSLGNPVYDEWSVETALAWVAVAVAIAAAIAGWSRPKWALAGVAFGCSVGLFVVPAGLSGFPGRYWAAPAMLVVTAVVGLLDPTGPQTQMRYRAPMFAFAVLLTVTCIANLRIDNSRAHGPSWRGALAVAREKCRSPAARVVALQVAPARTRRWVLHVPCAYVKR